MNTTGDTCYMSIKLKYRYHLFVLFLFFLGCRSKKTQVTLTIKTHDHNADIISNAAILLNYQTIGYSNQNGFFVTEIALEQLKQYQLTVNKEDPKYYYAPYNQSISLEKELKQDVAIVAKLFRVEKPMPIEDKPAKQNAQDLSPATAIEKLPFIGEGSQSKKLMTKEDILNKFIHRPALENKKRPTQPPSIYTPVSSQITQNEIFKKSNRSKTSPSYIRMKIFTDQRPLRSTKISGYLHNVGIKTLCQTNLHGFCRFKRPNKQLYMKIYITKPGYLTKTKKIKLLKSMTYKFYLKKGRNIDIFTFVDYYNYRKPIENITVKIQNKKAGHTNKEGYLRINIPQKQDELIPIQLHHPDYLPAHYQTDFVAAGSLTLIKYFTPKISQPIYISVLPTKVLHTSLVDTQQEKKIDRLLGPIFGSRLFNYRHIQPLSLTRLRSLLEVHKMDIETISTEGWNKTPLVGELQAIIIPKLSTIPRGKILELILISPKTQIIAANYRLLKNFNNKAIYENIVHELVQKLLAAFPFEGSILKKKNQILTINLGEYSGAALDIGDQLLILGNQLSPQAHMSTYQKIGRAKIVSIASQQAKAEVTEQAPRALISIGDKVKIIARKKQWKKRLKIHVRDHRQLKPLKSISQANVYIDGEWQGFTSETGWIYLSDHYANHSVKLMIIKPGYKSLYRKITIPRNKSIQFTLEKKYLRLKIHSVPSEAKVFINRLVVGKTPLITTVPLFEQVVKLEVQAPHNHYKSFIKYLDVSNEQLSFTGRRKIFLEVNLLSKAKVLLKKKAYRQTIKLIETIKASHSDYIPARFLAGQIFLQYLKEPAKASAAFGDITKRPEISSFSNKMYIGAHTNEAMAIIATGEKLLNNKKFASAKKHFEKAIYILQRTQPYLRYMKISQQNQGFHNFFFYIALASQHLWILDKTPYQLKQAQQAWEKYKNIFSKYSLQHNKTYTHYENTAAIYFKQNQTVLKTTNSQ